MLAVEQIQFNPSPLENGAALELPRAGDVLSGAEFTAHTYRQGVHEQRGALGLSRDQIERIITLP